MKLNYIWYSVVGMVVALLLIIKLLWLNNIPILAYTVSATLYLGITIILALDYKEPADSQITPSASVLIPVYNEDKDTVSQVIQAALNSDYDNLKEVIVVDDGSAKPLNDEFKTLPKVKVIHLPHQGNKFARAAGIRVAKGEVLVFIDSDTILRPDAVRRIVQPFHQLGVGAVSGHIQVKNDGVNMLTRLQAGWYFTGFRLYRSVEHRSRFVTCCSGAFSAYRRSVLSEEVLNNWLYGRFCGLEVSYGMDRALTSLVLRRHDIVYQSTAIAETIVPENWGKFIKQQVRWTKSWIRETLFLLTFAYKRGLRSLFFYTSAILHLLNYVILFYVFFIAPLTWPLYPVVYLGGLLIPGVIHGLFSRTLVREWKWRILLPIVLASITLPIMLYSILTIRNSKWGTR